MAHTPRCYVDHALREGESLQLPQDVRKHLISVLRMRSGEPLCLFNGDGNNYQATLVSTDKAATVQIEHSAPGPSAGTPITLALGVSRGDRMDYAIQKSTELGVAKIQPLWTEKCGAKIPGDRLAKKMQHWRNVTISASEQCGRCDIPAVYEPQNFATWLSNAPPGFLFTPSAKTDLLSYQGEIIQERSLLIGPESGLTENEVQAALKAQWQPATLGPLILRTETAAAVAVALLRALDRSR